MNTQEATSPNAKQDEEAFVSLAQEFMTHIRDLTPGKKLEAKLNKDYGPESEYYKGVSIRANQFVDTANQYASLRNWHYGVSKM